MSKDLKSIVDGLKSTIFFPHSLSPPRVLDPGKKRAAARILKYYSKLPQELRTAIVPALQEITGSLFSVIPAKNHGCL